MPREALLERERGAGKEGGRERWKEMEKEDAFKSGPPCYTMQLVYTHREFLLGERNVAEVSLSIIAINFESSERLSKNRPEILISHKPCINLYFIITYFALIPSECNAFIFYFLGSIKSLLFSLQVN